LVPNQVYFQNWANPRLGFANDCVGCGSDLSFNPVCSNCG
jgi:hypothetical protein